MSHSVSVRAPDRAVTLRQPSPPLLVARLERTSTADAIDSEQKLVDDRSFTINYQYRHHASLRRLENGQPQAGSAVRFGLRQGRGSELG